jgi:hypothetical protein
MTNILLSYRRNDSSGITGRIFDRLVAKFGSRSVFMDVDSIPIGLDFRQHINDELDRCDVLVAVIGKDWIGARNEGTISRINDEEDFVRVEIEAALERNIPVIPVLIDRASMPKADDLPSSLKPLAYRNAAEIDSGRDFQTHIDRLIGAIGRTVSEARPQSRSGKATSQSRSTGAVWVVGIPVLLAHLNGFAYGVATEQEEWLVGLSLIGLIIAAVAGFWLALVRKGYSGKLLGAMSGYALILFIAVIVFHDAKVKPVPLWAGMFFLTCVTLSLLVLGNVIGHLVRWIADVGRRAAGR